MRNAPLGMVSAGVTFTCWGIAGIFSHFAYIEAFKWLAGGLILGGFGAAALTIIRDIRGYPERLKPAWLMEAERRRRQHSD